MLPASRWSSPPQAPVATSNASVANGLGLVLIRIVGRGVMRGQAIELLESHHVLTVLGASGKSLERKKMLQADAAHGNFMKGVRPRIGADRLPRQIIVAFWDEVDPRRRRLGHRAACCD
jgi:hypothetical protein